MAARKGVATQTGIAIAGSTTTTALQVVAAANHAVKIKKVSCWFNGVNNTHRPILVELIRQTDAGTATALTLLKYDNSVADTLDTTAQHTATVEPTSTDILQTWTPHPQMGFVEPFADGDEPIVGAGDRIGLRVTTQDANANTIDATILFEE